MQQPRTRDGRYTFKPGAGDAPEAMLGAPGDMQARLDAVCRLKAASDTLNSRYGLETPDVYYQAQQEYNQACAALGVENASKVEITKAAGRVVLEAAEQQAGVDADMLADGQKQLIAQRGDLDKKIHDITGRLGVQEGALAYRMLSDSDFELPEDSGRSDDFKDFHECYMARQQLNEIINDRTPYLELAEHYKDTLAKIRPMGGEHEYHPKATKAAKAAFDEALSCYPSDWVANSSADPNKLLPKMGKSRAHYVHRKIEQSKKKVRMLATTTLEGLARIEEDPRYELATLEDFVGHFDEGEEDIARANFNAGQHLAMFDIKTFDPERPAPPRGKGWKLWDHPYKDVSYWRRPQTRMKTTKLEAVSEITTSKAGNGVYATCVHELAHRMEYTARAGIAVLEEGYLDSRTTGEGDIVLYGGRLNRGKPEVARKTDFVDAYMGRVYPEGDSFEVMSCGMEGLFGGSYKGLGGDRDMREFILGVLATS
ncbi:hypothetical protein QP568_03695 [Propionimicrobium lymphophilum]|uniref:hypothetical protein n=1 Tax=Propionimicrobium lymphophilum TaxID=33012 RepID=UPI00255073F8|nr:hypothetical protein [Propionimicrobium lymphophilum]MDK7709414.1 hypothetical protein [Propionimicrobium lymphophilum]MDK7733400.1 hypothetical protein [Propionimicrobium lymphophilum]